jgi:hypothetical protein
MGLISSSQLARCLRSPLQPGVCLLFAMSVWLASVTAVAVLGQGASKQATVVTSPHAARARRFLGGRTLAGNASAARMMDAAR